MGVTATAAALEAITRLGAAHGPSRSSSRGLL